MIQNKISKLTYEEVKKELGKEFYMPHDESDAVRRISHENGWDRTKKDLIDRWGDVEVIVDRDAEWSDQIKVIDAKFMAAQRRYEEDKAAWCAKYGCD